ncbi:hypothetical protein, partial [Xylanibacter brevis]|uniref:hypothetical protein n=1 Tax=Xylanibacter brevis TaxID=83231 RepID=UPI002658649F
VLYNTGNNIKTNKINRPTFWGHIKIFDENTQQYVALQEGFLGDRIGDARNLKQNLKKNL